MAIVRLLAARSRVLGLFLPKQFAPGEQVVTLAVFHRVIWHIASLPGVGIHLAGAHLSKDFFVDDGGAVK